MAEIGSMIQGKYKVLEMIGKGGMSKVYLVQDQNLRKQWAVKEIERKPGDAQNAEFVKTAMVEAELMKTLDHPLLPRIVDIIDEEKVIYVVMDYIEGEPLKEALEKTGAQPQELVVEWAKQLAAVFDYLHTRKPPVIYRDMKPANVMLQPNGSVKLIDFGTACEYVDGKLTSKKSLGTRGYAAPEQLAKGGKVDMRSDIYTLGVTFYQLVTGKNPCEASHEMQPIRYWNPQLSGGLEAIIQKCTQENPEDRYQSCAELLYALSHYTELDENHRKKQIRKLRIFGAAAAATILSLVTSLTCQAMKSYTNNSDYDNNILQAEKSSTNEEKINYYTRAVDINPTKLTAYTGLIDTFKDDAVFSVEEESGFIGKVKENMQGLQQTDGYAELAFEIGKMYWYYYDYGKTEHGDNQVTRMKYSVRWFEDAYNYGDEDDSFHMMSRIYSDIGQFNGDIILKVEEADDKGTYLPYWENLTALVAQIEGQANENEIVNLEVYKLAINAIETYARKFKADGVTQEAMTALIGQVTNGIAVVEPTTDKTEEMKSQIQQRIASAEKAVENAYAKSSGGGLER